jgi:hypothetical protein
MYWARQGDAVLLFNGRDGEASLASAQNGPVSGDRHGFARNLGSAVCLCAAEACAPRLHVQKAVESARRSSNW